MESSTKLPDFQSRRRDFTTSLLFLCLRIKLYAGLESFVSGIMAGVGLFFSRVTAQFKVIRVIVVYAHFGFQGTIAGRVLMKQSLRWDMISKTDKDDE